MHLVMMYKTCKPGRGISRLDKDLQTWVRGISGSEILNQPEDKIDAHIT